MRLLLKEKDLFFWISKQAEEKEHFCNFIQNLDVGASTFSCPHGANEPQQRSLNVNVLQFSTFRGSKTPKAVESFSKVRR